MGVVGRIWLAAKSYWGIRDDRQSGIQPGSHHGSAGNYQSYMIRFWRTNSTMPWRVAIVDPRRDAIQYFASREALYAFLDAQIDNQDAGAQQI
jgi:hypothetical protein